jgi:3-hydroxyisobutyrate dehydrogenase
VVHMAGPWNNAKDAVRSPAETMGLAKVAFFGLGIMGWPMAANLVRAGYELSVWTHSEGKADRFASDHGVRAGATPRAAAEGADAAITMVVDSPEVEATLLGDDGAAGGLNDGALCIDMSTIAPSAATALGERLTERGLEFLEAPVSGSRPKAEDGTLTIMAGGTDEAFGRARPLLDAMGELIVHVGPQGHGQMAKVLTNMMGAVNAAGLGEGVTVARKAGLDPGAFLEVAGGSAGNSTVLKLKGKPMFEHDFDPLFKLEHMLKDLRHALSEARRLGVELDLAQLAERLYARAAEEGHGHEDFAAIVTAVEGDGRTP